MKRLTRMKLINWHRFTDATIDFGSSTLLSGENGAGKSTLLDAIQFVVTCSSGSFNKAAHENGKRKLTGYIRCKTGRENKPYERTGQISAHIALEFYEESRDKYFVVGAVVDSASEGQETVARYLIENARFTDEMFLKGMYQPKSISEFRSSNKIRQWCKTNSEAKKMMKSRFGRLEDKFFSLIPKALAFKPIDDIKDFVYSYVLDEKEVNIDLLRENVRSFQELERTLDSVKKRIAKLEVIEKHYDEVMDAIQKDKMYEYFLTRARLDITRESIRVAQEAVKKEEYRLTQEQRELETLIAEKNQKQEIETMLRIELKQNAEFLALEEQRKQLERLEEEEDALLSQKVQLKKSAKKAITSASVLEKEDGVLPCVAEYRKMLEGLEDISDLAPVQQAVEELIRYKQELYGTVARRLAELDLQRNNLLTKRQELEEKIARLEKKKLSYAPAVDRLVDAVKADFIRVGRETEPRVLCELLEITDESWRNAVEGYLNTQRFYVLVEPEDFDIALGTYDKLRRQKKAYGVGLINTQKLEEYDVSPQGTLASVVTSRNIHARRFANMILGKVNLCSRYEELKRYPVSITKEGMKYQNRVASAIHPSVFEVPFIGRNAVRVQLQQAKAQLEELKRSLTECKEKIQDLKRLEDSLGTEADVDVKYRLPALRELELLHASMKKCEDNIKTLEKSSNFSKKQVQLKALELQRRDLENQIAKKNQVIGKSQERIESRRQEIAQLSREESVRQEEADRLLEDGEKAGVLWQRDYEKQTRQKSFSQFYENFERRRKANETTRKNAEDRMIDMMIQYKTEHDFGAAASLLGFPEFQAVYDRLKNSELLEYEDKVRAARMAAEDEFREQFLAKLQENMKQAQGEFKELNRALKDISFSNERYEFLYMPSRHYRNYYEMIMDDFNAIQGESIFAGTFHEAHKEVIDELFSRLALDNENSARALDEFTDYRTYMDYDIRIIHSDGSYSLYSKVCEEKSGGETQTPFYVTVAASFVQLYSNNIGGEAVGLVMFDEAFNNMDDERIGGVLEFLRRLPLQIIIAAPPDKIQYIGPSMEETLLVMTDEKVSYVEEYYNGAVRKAHS
ncbi:MAG: SbcC/MukB-like Walker B domain-containing protein [Eubacteriales bacterium]|nr:SbcC/MukB-like Walker B domain-containing protein [Eubacteriales bacterium]